ncbi:MAG TPA: hypothetical protein VGU46_07845 [Acidobacteriaceae bacterium]|nr:hypothetical protein [Acidobacteriaceae bacterium]
MLAYAVLLSIYSIPGFPTAPQTSVHWPWLGNKPVSEDGFYMLTVADNIARTGHIVYNYGRPATGIQPLSTFVFAGIAWLVHRMHASEWTFIRAMILEGTALFVCFAWGVGFFVASLAPQNKRKLAFTFAFFLTLFDYDLFRLFTYGLETGIYLCLQAACLCISLRMMQQGKSSWRQVLLLGILGGAAGLARIDFGILFAILLLWMLIRRVLRPLQMLTCGSLALIITAPWFLFVRSVSGSWLPSSGHAESRLMSATDFSRIGSMTNSVSVHLFPWIYSHLPRQACLALTVVSLAGIAALLLRAPQTRTAWLRRYLADIAPWIAGALSLVAIYLLGFAATMFYPRYISLIFLLAVPITALLFAEQPGIAARPALVLGPISLLFVFYCYSTLHTGLVGNNLLIDAGYIRQYYPDAHVASFQSGTIGFFDRNVENLDGKLNDDALKAIAEHRMGDYLDRAGINVLVEWPGYISENFSPEYIARVWQPCPQPMYPGGGVCLIRRSTLSTP